jgi:phage anti-repressor protein
MIDARRLHNWLGCGRTFGAWVRGRIEEYGFEEGVDFIPVSEKTRGRPRTDYLLTLDTAKELAMVERTDIGRDTRRYFIQKCNRSDGSLRTIDLDGTPWFHATDVCRCLGLGVSSGTFNHTYKLGSDEK